MEVQQSPEERRAFSSASPEEKSAAFSRHCSTRRRWLFIVLAVGIAAALLGFLIGYFVPKSREKSECSERKKGTEFEHVGMFSKFEEEVSVQELEQNLRFFSQMPHVGGSERQSELAKYLASKWREYEFDDVETKEYKVLLSYPMDDNPNMVSVEENENTVEEIKIQTEVSSEPHSNTTFLYTPYIAYSPNGTTQGKLVYINWGTKDDFDELAKQNVTLNGTIWMTRSIYSVRATALQALTRGAKGILVYPDPKDHGDMGGRPNSTYPNSPWISPQAVQMNKMYNGYGDPLSPGLPALDGMYRTENADFKDIPPILVQTVSFGDAKRLLRAVGGDEVPSDWTGGLGVTGFKNSNATVKLSVHNRLETKSIYNVIGTIAGVEEPDRYVLIGNHRDSWFFGGVDASTGSSVLTETSRILNRLLKQGWRPRRTIKLCSFGAEEFGVVGSVEWVEENLKELESRGVAYLNADVPVQGNAVLFAQTSPLFGDLIFKWTKNIKVPVSDGSYQSMYDVMVKKMPSPDHPGEPMLSPFMFESDYIPFYFKAHIPAAGFSYFFGVKQGHYVLYPSYHTQEDTFYWVKKFGDPRFEMHRAMTLLVGGMLLDLADSKIIPFSVMRLKDSLLTSYNSLMKSNITPLLERHGITTNEVNRSLEEFSKSCDMFVASVSEISSEMDVHPLTLRMLNNQLIEVEKVLLDSRVFLQSPVKFQHAAFGGVFTALTAAEKNGDWDQVHKELSLMSVAISSAAKVLKPLKMLSDN